MAYFQEINGFSSDIRRNCTSSRRYTCCETICDVRCKRPGYDKPIYLHLNHLVHPVPEK